MDNNVIELQKQLQRAGYNYVAQSGNSNDALTRKAIEAMNTSRNYGAGVGKSALTQQGMDYLKQYATKPTADTTSQLKQAIATPQQPQAPAYTPAPDNSGMINQQYGSLVGALKAQIQQSINNKNQQIANKPQEYQPFKNENDVNRSNNMRSVLEQNANAGDNGGVGRQNTLEVDTNRDNVLNSLNQSQNNDINALKNEISDLVLTGNIQEAQLQAKKLQDLIANSQYVDTQNYSRGQDQFNNDMSLGQLLGNYQGQRTMQGQSFDRGVLESDRNYGREVLESDRTFNYTKEQNTLNRKFQEEQTKIDNAYKNHSLSLEGARVALAQAQDKRDADMEKLDKDYKQLQINNYNKPTDAELRAQAVQMATDTTMGTFNRDLFDQIYNTLKSQPTTPPNLDKYFLP